MSDDAQDLERLSWIFEVRYPIHVSYADATRSFEFGLHALDE